MTAIAPVLVWCFAGWAGLRCGGTEPAHRGLAVADYILAAFLGPFSFLISFLAVHMLPNGEAEEGAAQSEVLGHEGQDRGQG